MPDDSHVSYRQVMVGRFPTGMTGLDELFEDLFQQGRGLAESLGLELLTRAKEHNYIPRSAEEDFAATLLHEYGKYWKQRQAGQKPGAGRKTWRGIPREQVLWFPMLDQVLCDGCDKCLDFYGNGVYAKRDSGTVHVAQPFDCVVGCDACARLCRHGAITFPPKSMLCSFDR